MGTSRFQFSLRALLVLTGIVAIILGSAMAFGVAATATVLTIVVAAFLLYCCIPRHLRRLPVRIAVYSLTLLAVYLGSFAAFRTFRTYEFSLAHDDDPQHNVVVFSLEPSVQQFARDFYSPLIRLFPAHCYYPDQHEMRLVNRAGITLE